MKKKINMEKEEKVVMEETVKEIEGKQIYSELPGILVSKVGKVDMFNVDYFLEKINSDLKVEQYLTERSRIVDLYAKATDTEKKFLVMKLEGEPTMMHFSMALDFACWAIPIFEAYSMERMNELLINGFSTSDRYLAMASKRLGQSEDKK